MLFVPFLFDCGVNAIAFNVLKYICGDRVSAEMRSLFYISFCLRVFGGSNADTYAEYFNLSGIYVLTFALVYLMITSGLMFFYLRAKWIKLSLDKCDKAVLCKNGVKTEIVIRGEENYRVRYTYLTSFTKNLYKSEDYITFINGDEEVMTLYEYLVPKNSEYFSNYKYLIPRNCCHVYKNQAILLSAHLLEQLGM